MVSKPLVTAFINTHNYARYLPFAINSVLNQTYSNIEIIVVDDGSTDHTPEILTQYEGRLRAIRTENGGQGHAFNVGIPLANGELLMMLDADDMWLPQKVERMVEFAFEQPAAGMLYHRFQNIDRNSREVGAPEPFYLINGDYRTRYIRRGGGWWSPITSVLTVRTQLIRRALPIPTYAVREGADTIIADYCVLTSEVASLPDALTLRRLHGANLYAEGRASHYYRSKEIRESDVRRVEWRMLTIQQVMKRVGAKFEINVNNNDWRMINLYWLNRISFWKVIWAGMFSLEGTGLKFRWRRLRWILDAKRSYRNG
jgi:glycosyltransferase involved in cell wall biosynthesis